MAIEMELYQLKTLLADSAELGAQAALMQAGKMKDGITQAKAYRLFGKAFINRMKNAKLIHSTTSETGRIEYSRKEIEAARKAIQTLK